RPIEVDVPRSSAPRCGRAAMWARSRDQRNGSLRSAGFFFVAGRLGTAVALGAASDFARSPDARDVDADGAAAESALAALGEPTGAVAAGTGTSCSRGVSSLGGAVRGIDAGAVTCADGSRTAGDSCTRGRSALRAIAATAKARIGVAMRIALRG